MTQETLYLSPRQAAKFLNDAGLAVTEDTVRRWIRGNLIPALTLTGGQYRIHKLQLEAILNGELLAARDTAAAS